MFYLLSRIVDWTRLRGYRLHGDTRDGFNYSDRQGRTLYIGKTAWDDNINLWPCDLSTWTKPAGVPISEEDRRIIVANLRRSMRWEGVEVFVHDDEY